MNKMSRQQFLRWEKLRMRGERLYIAKAAILYGVLAFIGLNAVSWAWSGTALAREFVILYPILGAIFGMIAWSVNEQRFAAFLEHKRTNARPQPKGSR